MKGEAVEYEIRMNAAFDTKAANLDLPTNAKKLKMAKFRAINVTGPNGTYVTGREANPKKKYPKQEPQEQEAF